MAAAHMGEQRVRILGMWIQATKCDYEVSTRDISLAKQASGLTSNGSTSFETFTSDLAALSLVMFKD